MDSIQRPKILTDFIWPVERMDFQVVVGSYLGYLEMVLLSLQSPAPGELGPFVG